MRLSLPCMMCFQERGQPDEVLYFAELRDPWCFELTCRNRHKSVVLLQAQRFEVLAELAANAIADGYYREAVSSFAASLERFYEFYLRVVAISAGVAESALEDAWKELARQSERQLGAYIATYLLANKSRAPTLAKSQIEFRNKIVHKGLVPSREQAIEFGNQVIKVIHEVSLDLKKAHRESLSSVVSDQLRRLQGKVPAELSVSTMAWPTIVSLIRNDDQPQVEAWVAKLKNRRWTMADG